MKSIIKGGHVLLPHADDFVKLDIMVDDSGNISELGDDIAITGNEMTHVIDVTDKYIIPGLINAHAHLFATGNLSDRKITPAKVKTIATLLNTVVKSGTVVPDKNADFFEPLNALLDDIADNKLPESLNKISLEEG